MLTLKWCKKERKKRPIILDLDMNSNHQSNVIANHCSKEFSSKAWHCVVGGTIQSLAEFNIQKKSPRRNLMWAFFQKPYKMLLNPGRLPLSFQCLPVGCFSIDVSSPGPYFPRPKTSPLWCVGILQIQRVLRKTCASFRYLLFWQTKLRLRIKTLPSTDHTSALLHHHHQSPTVFPSCISSLNIFLALSL